MKKHLFRLKKFFLCSLLLGSILIPAIAWGQSCTITGGIPDRYDNAIKRDLILNSLNKQVFSGVLTIDCRRSFSATFTFTSARALEASAMYTRALMFSYGMSSSGHDPVAGYLDADIYYKLKESGHILVNERVDLVTRSINGGPSGVGGTVINLPGGKVYMLEYTVVVDAQKLGYQENNNKQELVLRLLDISFPASGAMERSVTFFMPLDSRNRELCNASAFEVMVPNRNIDFGALSESSFANGQSHFRTGMIIAKMKPDNGCKTELQPRVTLYAIGTPNSQNEVPIGDSGLLLSVKAKLGRESNETVEFGKKYEGSTIPLNGMDQREEMFFYIRKDPSKPLKPGGFSTTVRYVYSYR